MLDSSIIQLQCVSLLIFSLNDTPTAENGVLESLIFNVLQFIYLSSISEPLTFVLYSSSAPMFDVCVRAHASFCFLWFLLAWGIFSIPPFSVTLKVRWASCRQHIIGFYFCIYPVNLFSSLHFYLIN